MKKKIVGIAIMAAIALAAGWNISQNSNEVNLTDLAFENVDALASGESAKDCPGGTRLCAWIRGPEGTVTYYLR